MRRIPPRPWRHSSSRGEVYQTAQNSTRRRAWSHSWCGELRRVEGDLDPRSSWCYGGTLYACVRREGRVNLPARRDGDCGRGSFNRHDARSGSSENTHGNPPEARLGEQHARRPSHQVSAAPIRVAHLRVGTRESASSRTTGGHGLGSALSEVCGVRGGVPAHYESRGWPAGSRAGGGGTGEGGRPPRLVRWRELSS